MRICPTVSSSLVLISLSAGRAPLFQLLPHHSVFYSLLSCSQEKKKPYLSLPELALALAPPQTSVCPLRYVFLLVTRPVLPVSPCHVLPIRRYDGPVQQALVHPHQPLARHSTGAARRRVSKAYINTTL